MSDPDAFLVQEVESATPAKLRWLLIRKAVGLCHACKEMWLENKFTESIPWMINVRDILGELLDGVTDRNNPVAGSVSDLYVFLLKTVLVAEQSHDAKALQGVIEVLEIELETWDAFVRKEAATSIGQQGPSGAVESTLDGCISMLNLFA